MNIINKNTVFFALISGLLIGICQQKSIADPIGKDLKSITATMCKTNQTGDVIYHTNGLISNTNRFKSLIVTCPLIKDVMNSGPELSAVYVLYENNNSDIDLQCNLIYYDGDFGFSNSFKLYKLPPDPAIPFPRTSVLYISADRIKKYNRPYSSRSTYSVTCEIPPKMQLTSEIFSINYGEKI